jgi:uncharacterized protein
MLAKIGRTAAELLGNRDMLTRISPSDFVDERFGLPTVRDILAELEKPGRDPRPEFKTAAFRDGIEKVSDLEPGMILEGVVTNVAAFGAFIDIGVHQDGLVHVSALSTRFIRDPHEVVKAGQVVQVKVVEIDLKRQRIALTMRLDDDISAASTAGERAGASGNTGGSAGGGRRDDRSSSANRSGQSSRANGRSSSSAPADTQSAMAAAFAKLKQK